MYTHTYIYACMCIEDFYLFTQEIIKDVYLLWMEFVGKGSKQKILGNF